MSSLEKDLLVVITSWIAQDVTLYVMSPRFKLMMRSIKMLQDTGRWTGMYKDEFTRVVTGINMTRLQSFVKIIEKADELNYNYPRPAQLDGLPTNDQSVRENKQFAATVVKRMTAFDQKEAARVMRCIGVVPPPPKTVSGPTPPPPAGPPPEVRPSASASSLSSVYGAMPIVTARRYQTQPKAAAPKSTPATSKARGPEIRREPTTDVWFTYERLKTQLMNFGIAEPRMNEYWATLRLPDEAPVVSGDMPSYQLDAALNEVDDTAAIACAVRHISDADEGSRLDLQLNVEAATKRLRIGAKGASPAGGWVVDPAPMQPPLLAPKAPPGQPPLQQQGQPSAAEIPASTALQVLGCAED